MREVRHLHVVITTHTPRHLAAVLAGLSRQSDRPDSVTITCDTDDAAIGSVIERWRVSFGDTGLRWVRRAHTGIARPAQVRNNGVRVLRDAGLLEDDDLLLMLDGDIVLNDGALSAHRALANEGYDVIIGFRVPLDPGATELFDSARYARGGAELAVDDEQRDALRRRQARYERDLRFRRLPWSKKHRPKMIGCHHAVSAGVYRTVNGYDEEYDGYASEDDDFSRRVNALRPTIAIAVERIPAFHLWHPTRDTPNRKKEGAYLRFKRGGSPTAAARGLERPREQPDLRVTLFEAESREVDAGTS